jgi:hypothetical protein
MSTLLSTHRSTVYWDCQTFCTCHNEQLPFQERNLCGFIYRRCTPRTPTLARVLFRSRAFAQSRVVDTIYLTKSFSCPAHRPNSVNSHKPDSLHASYLSNINFTAVQSSWASHSKKSTHLVSVYACNRQKKRRSNSTLHYEWGSWLSQKTTKRAADRSCWHPWYIPFHAGQFGGDLVVQMTQRMHVTVGDWFH